MVVTCFGDVIIWLKENVILFVLISVKNLSVSRRKRLRDKLCHVIRFKMEVVVNHSKQIHIRDSHAIVLTFQFRYIFCCLSALFSIFFLNIIKQYYSSAHDQIRVKILLQTNT